jgi:phosphoribosylformimino-5-aminoimidazole carboxamide ribotide isomerase
MDLWPAIDIRDGRAVRLLQGDFDQETSYGDPEAVALSYLSMGAKRLHLVDLDAARTGERRNSEAIAAIAKRAKGVEIQLGGGLRDADSIEAAFALGVGRVVMGTAAAEQPDLVRELARRWPGRVVAGLDYRTTMAEGETTPRRELAVRGWTGGSGRQLGDVLYELAGAALAGVVATDISRDGTGAGPDIDGLGAILATTALPLVASGGVASVEDLDRLAKLGAHGRHLEGVIVGKALLSGRLTIAAAAVACGEPIQ